MGQTSKYISTLLSFLIIALLPFLSSAQDSANHHINKASYPPGTSLSKQQMNRRLITVSGGNIIGYGGSLILFNSAWYKNYPRQSFHTFNDIKEWQQVDKVGHAWAAYNTGKVSTAMWRWAGRSQKTISNTGSNTRAV